MMIGIIISTIGYFMRPESIDKIIKEVAEAWSVHRPVFREFAKRNATNISKVSEEAIRQKLQEELNSLARLLLAAEATGKERLRRKTRKKFMELFYATEALGFQFPNGYRSFMKGEEGVVLQRPAVPAGPIPTLKEFRDMT